MVKKDKIYTKWIYDYRNGLSESKEFFEMNMYEYEFIFRGESDPPGSWFVEVGDDDDTDEGLYNAGYLFDSKIECIEGQIESLEDYLACCEKYKNLPAFEIQAEDLAELEFFKRELQLEIESMGNK